MLLFSVGGGGQLYFCILLYFRSSEGVWLLCVWNSLNFWSFHLQIHCSFWVFSFQRISRICWQIWMIHSFSFWVQLLNCSFFFFLYTDISYQKKVGQNNKRISKWWKIVIFKRTLPLISGVNKASKNFVVVSLCELNSLFIDIKTLFICTR